MNRPHAPPLLAILLALSGACQPPGEKVAGSVEFTKLPPAGQGNPDKLEMIEGRVQGAKPGQRVVLFARSGVWWVQPTMKEPFTEIRGDGGWKNATHPGSAYAALLVDHDYHPPSIINSLPAKGGSVVSVAVAESASLTRRAPKTLRFSGYDWEIRQVASDRGGTRNIYDPTNAWTDEKGFLHLRIGKQDTRWTSAEVSLLRSLGYGSYSVVVRDTSHLEPAGVFSIFTWDDAGPTREMNIEIARWGEAASKNGQYVIQPYYVPANVVRFMAPAGKLTHSFRWEPGRVSFQTTSPGGRVVDEHAFTSGVPYPGQESVHLNLYVFDNKTSPLQRGCEVIIEKFEFLP